MKKKSLVFLLSALLSSFCLPSCQTNRDEPEGDILTQKAEPKDKISVTVLVKYAFSIHNFEKIMEEKFPRLNLIQVGNYTSDMGIKEYEARLKNNDLTDIVMTWPLDVGKEYWADRLLDLSSLPVTSNYTTRSLQNISGDQDGKLYYLPGPSQVRGIVYNQTMFENKGWSVPKSYDEFVALCQTIEKTGIRSLQLGLANEEVLDTAFVGYGYGDSFSKPSNATAIANFNDGKESFSNNFSPALDTFEDLVNKGILKKEDLAIDYAKREKMLFTRECAMVEDSVLMARMGESITGIKDKFALMPFFNPGADNDWARIYPVCFIGFNQNLKDPQQKDKYNLILEMIDYISTPEGQLALASDTSAMFSPLKTQSVPDDVEEISDLVPALNAGRYAIFPTLKNAQSALRKGLAGIVNGTISKADVIKMVDEGNLNPPALLLPSIIGEAKENFTMIETGNFVTDAMRKKAQTDIALFLDNGKDGLFNGKGISGKFYKGQLTDIDVKRVFPDLKQNEKGVLTTVEMRGSDLIQTLEYSIPVDNEKTGWFYYFSGLKMTYAPSKEPGSRIQKLTLADGRAVEENKFYTIAVMDQSVPENLCRTIQESTISIVELIKQEIQSQRVIQPSHDHRFTIGK